jgi:hypothetical protein
MKQQHTACMIPEQSRAVKEMRGMSSRAWHEQSHLWSHKFPYDGLVGGNHRLKTAIAWPGQKNCAAAHVSCAAAVGGACVSIAVSRGAGGCVLLAATGVLATVEAQVLGARVTRTNVRYDAT